MKKSLVALAVAAALPAFAQAQTSIQLTGSVDVAVESLNKEASGTGKSDLRRYAERHGWAGHLAVASVSVRWQEIVGARIAEHAVVESFEPGRLTLRASSSAWAQQLRLLLPTIERRVTEALGRGGGAVDIRIMGPGGPTWRSGRFGAARGGRGPRDTYG